MGGAPTAGRRGQAIADAIVNFARKRSNFSGEGGGVSKKAKFCWRLLWMFPNMIEFMKFNLYPQTQDLIWVILMELISGTQLLELGKVTGRNFWSTSTLKVITQLWDGGPGSFITVCNLLILPALNYLRLTAFLSKLEQALFQINYSLQRMLTPNTFLIS